MTVLDGRAPRSVPMPARGGEGVSRPTDGGRARSLARSVGLIAVRMLLCLGVALVIVILVEAWRPDWVVAVLAATIAG